MDLLKTIRPECLVTGATLANKTQALELIAQTACRAEALKEIKPEVVLRALTEREKLGSTAFGNGIAIPHCRLPKLNDFVVGFVAVPAGVSFGADDEKPVRIMAFIIAPEQETNDHVRLLAAISRILREPNAVEDLATATSPESLLETLRLHSEADAVMPYEGRCLIHIFIRHEELVRSVLHALAGISRCSAVTLDAESMEASLREMPLFAGVWFGEESPLAKVILAVVPKNMTNEAVRRVGQAVGGLDKTSGVLLLVQTVFFSAGSL